MIRHRVTLSDAESGRTRLYDTGSNAFRSGLRGLAARHVADIRGAFQQSGIDFIHIDASQSVVDPLVKFFRMRERRGGR